MSLSLNAPVPPCPCATLCSLDTWQRISGKRCHKHQAERAVCLCALVSQVLPRVQTHPLKGRVPQCLERTLSVDGSLEERVSQGPFFQFQKGQLERHYTGPPFAGRHTPEPSPRAHNQGFPEQPSGLLFAF